MKILLTQFAAYHVWANQQLLDVMQPLPQSLKDQKVVSSFDSLTKTLLHIWDAESIWWQRMQLQEQIVRPSDGFAGTFAEQQGQLNGQV